MLVAGVLVAWTRTFALLALLLTLLVFVVPLALLRTITMFGAAPATDDCAIEEAIVGTLVGVSVAALAGIFVGMVVGRVCVTEYATGFWLDPWLELAPLAIAGELALPLPAVSEIVFAALIEDAIVFSLSRKTRFWAPISVAMVAPAASAVRIVSRCAVFNCAGF